MSPDKYYFPDELYLAAGYLASRGYPREADMLEFCSEELSRLRVEVESLGRTIKDLKREQPEAPDDD